ncbi:uncharacterized protein [Lepisosteus oculatus]|uniref:uncharacterized protein isoform X2 n=1 Tax=Lepisosteus oculatus TaxID=7918 RepID=UPI0035F52129
MPSGAARQLTTAQFLTKLGAIVENPEITSFQWGESGRSVIIKGTVYEEEINTREHLMFLKKFKTTAMLRGLLCTYGFQKMARRSRGNLQEFHHPDFSRTSAKQNHRSRRRANPSSPGRPHTGTPLLNVGKTDISAGEQAPAARVPLGIPAEFECEGQNSHTDCTADSAVRARRVRPLYQYIHHGLPALASVPAEPASRRGSAQPPASLSPSGEPAATRASDCMSPGTAGGSCGQVIAPLELDCSPQDRMDRILHLCPTDLLPPLSPQ